MKVLAIDVGGTHVKILATDQKAPLKFISGPRMTAKQMVSGVSKLAAAWNYEVVSIGYPGPVLHGRILHEPHNLGSGWIRFDFEKAFRRPVKVINDAAMQALGSYKGGSMLFLGLGTGLGSAMIVNGLLEPMELGHLPYRKALTNIILAFAVSSTSAKKSGASMSSTWSNGCLLPSSRTTSCWAAAT